MAPKRIIYLNYNLDSIPPAATIVSPVMYAASSEAKNATIPAIFSGSPNLFETKNTYFGLAQALHVKPQCICLHGTSHLNNNIPFQWHLGKQSISCFLTFVHRQSKFCFDHTRCNAIDANVISSQHLAQNFCQSNQSSLAHRICTNNLLNKRIKNALNFYGNNNALQRLQAMDSIRHTMTSI